MRPLATVALCLAAVAVAAPAAERPLHGARAASAPKATEGVKQLVDLNSAPKEELATLPGVDAALADKIIAKRPYLMKTELVSKGVMPAGPFTSLRRLVVALPPKHAAKAKSVAKPAAKSAAKAASQAAAKP